jgi:hypothetical protein
MRFGVIDRRSNREVCSVPVPNEDNPYLLPAADTVVWHYLKFDYFRALLNGKAVWFSRLDKQSDKTDGQYSDANLNQTTPLVASLMEKMGKVEGLTPENLQMTNDILRRKSFIHCWSMRPKESAWMWNAFLRGESRSVAIRSTIGRLQFSFRKQPVGLIRVIYFPKGVPRPDWSYSAPFTAKDRDDFYDERELRLLVTNEMESQIEDGNKLIPTDIRVLFTKVVVHPLCQREFVEEVRAELRQCGIGIQVARSEFLKCHLQAVAKRK